MRRILVTIAAALLATTAAKASVPHVEVSVLPVSTADVPNGIRVTATNFGPGDAYFLSYHTVFAQPEGRTTGRWVIVEDASGREVPYVGRSVLIRSPGPSSYTRIPPGGTVSADVDLALEYALPETGEVTARVSVDILDRIPALDANRESEEVPHEIVESAAVALPVMPRFGRPAAPVTSIIQCSAEQLASTQAAVVAAQKASHEAADFLSSLYYTDPIDPENPSIPRVHMKPHLRYQYWFGTWDDSAPQLPDPEALHTDNAMVDQVMVATYARLLSGVRSVCDACVGYDPSSRAWNEGDLVHLCPVNFLDAVAGGINSQAGTIAHEVTHRVDTYASPTADFPGVKNRATAHALNRHSAVRSGANYEYFIMNVPLGRESAAKGNSGERRPASRELTSDDAR